MLGPRFLAKRAAQFLLLAFVASFVCDYAYFRLRMMHPRPGSPLETFTAPRLYAIAEKGRKVAYEMDALNPEQTLTCVHSLFPHAGYSPCWYLIPKSQKPIPM
jgi:hypothetical protein